MWREAPNARPNKHFVMLINVVQFVYKSASLLPSEMLDSYPKAILISCNIIYDTMILIDFFFFGSAGWDPAAVETYISLVTTASYILPGLTF